MNEEISVTIKNNTSVAQPVTLFTEFFAIPANISGTTYSWDISGESFFYGLVTPTVNIQYDTVPVTNLTPYTSLNLLSNTVAGVVAALNTLNIGTFYSVGNTIYVASSVYYFGGLILSPTFYTQITSAIPNGLTPAIDIWVNGSSVQTVPSGTSTIVTNPFGAAGDTIQVFYTAGVTATNWQITIDWYQPNNVISNLYTDAGVGANSDSHIFIYPPNGSVVITYTVT